MLYTPPGNLRNRLAARLAEKAGLSEDQAHRFLEALSDVATEEASAKAGLIVLAPYDQHSYSRARRWHDDG